MNLRKYFYIWLRTSILSLETTLTTKGASLMYIVGKFIRFFFFLWLLLRLGDQIEKVSGFTIGQLVTFFLVFNLFDIIGQLFFRGIYWFRQDVLSGRFDLTLLKPMGVLFQVLTNRTDPLDIPLLFVVLGFLIKQGLALSLVGWLWFLAMSIASLLLITAIHVLVAAMGVLTTEVDHTIMIYRDFSVMARVPIDIYGKYLRILLTVVIPVAIIMTIPAKALMGILSLQTAVFSLVFTVLFLLVSLRFWRFALSKHSSVSS